MESDELQAIRAARTQQLKQEGESGAAAASSEENQRAGADEMRREILASLLETSARERLSRIALVNPSLSTKIEALLLRHAQSGNVRGKISDEQLVGLLDQAESSQSSASAQKKGGVVFQRRKAFDSDDDDF
ncbi:DNA-binding TFAR19-related protein [Clavulina sp. PMI_390]|nr:DNA-binding TFAR19-related protein [Clavulina sp. PMI_390]